MTSPTTLPLAPVDGTATELRPAVVADVLAAIDTVLNPPEPTNGAAMAPSPPPAAGARLLEVIDALDEFAGPALAAPVARAAQQVTAELGEATTSAEYWRGVAGVEREATRDLVRTLLDARRALEVLGDGYAIVVLELARERERAERLAEYADLCASSSRMPTASRTAAVIREADKAANRRAAELLDAARAEQAPAAEAAP